MPPRPEVARGTLRVSPTKKAKKVAKGLDRPRVKVQTQVVRSPRDPVLSRLGAGLPAGTVEKPDSIP